MKPWHETSDAQSTDAAMLTFSEIIVCALTNELAGQRVGLVLTRSKHRSSDAGKGVGRCVIHGLISPIATMLEPEAFDMVHAALLLEYLEWPLLLPRVSRSCDS